MKNLKKYYTLKADPGDVYNALTNKNILKYGLVKMPKWKLFPTQNFHLERKYFRIEPRV